MPSNSFGGVFRITTFGESHGPAIGVVIDGCPAGIPLTEQDIQRDLQLRQPGKNPYTTPREEKDGVEILSGVFQKQTTGAPLALLIRNQDADSSRYEPIKDLMRPGHANFTYLKKYGLFDYRGGGRSSARETVARVAAGSIAKKIIPSVHTQAYVEQIGPIKAKTIPSNQLREKTYQSPIYCPDEDAAREMMALIEEVKKEGDSLGGVIGCIITGAPIGLGDPIYEKLEANLAKAMMSLPATKGFEIGSGFSASQMKGSKHNDAFTVDQEGKITCETNHAGGLLGGITTGLPIQFRVAFKPTSSIMKQQASVDLTGQKRPFQLPEGSRHDPCVTIRAVPIVEAMSAIVLADAYLMNRLARL